MRAAPFSSIAEARAAFRWAIPERYNMGVDICDRWAAAEPDRLAILDEDETGAARAVSFGELRALSNRLANRLAALGVGAGDRVGVLAPQRVETAAAHIAIWKLGAISIPLFTLFGADALSHRLADSGARAVIADGGGAAKLAALRGGAPELRAIIDVDADAAAIGAEDDRFNPADTRAEDPALLIYTSGTTGSPKGALHAHRVLPGHLPGVEMSHDFLPRPGDVMWTPADWAWIGGLLDLLAPALHHGLPVVARRFAKFDGAAAFDLIARRGVTSAFLPPTALKMMRASPGGEDRRAPMRSVASGGESLGAELLAWGARVFGTEINEFYGQTECNMVISSCGALAPPAPGRMGWPVPGHEVAVIDAAGAPAPQGAEGDIAVRRPDPVMFLGYWNNPAATAAKFRGDWLLTGDRGAREADGRLRFIGRDDDVISSSGYRIGPGEVEDCLLTHPAVAMAGVVGAPDPLRGEIVKAYVVARAGAAPGPALADALMAHVATRLAAHERPREIVFVEALPATTTGKIIRRALRDRARKEASRV